MILESNEIEFRNKYKIGDKVYYKYDLPYVIYSPDYFPLYGYIKALIIENIFTGYTENTNLKLLIHIPHHVPYGNDIFIYEHQIVNEKGE